MLYQKKLTIEVSILIIILLAVFIRWFIVFDKEASAPPIVIDETTSAEEQSRFLIQTQGKNDNPIEYTNGITKINFNNTDQPGKSGYRFAGLGQPCYTEEQSTTLPNLPDDYEIQKCDSSKDEECMRGIFQGNVCLKIINGECNLKSDCSLEANFCINNLCQQKGEVINKVCKTDKDCKGTLGQLNHKCDPGSKRCVYDIWTKDSGCTNKKQCLYNKDYPNLISCLKSEDGGDVITTDGKYNSGVITLTNPDKPIENLVKTDLKNIYAIVKGNKFSSRLKILNSEGTSITFGEDVGLIEDQEYSVIFGNKRDGLCTVNYPLGTQPSVIPGTENTKYRCAEGLEPLEGYCAENERKPGPNGEDGQVCIYDVEELGCKKGLSCTFEPALYRSYVSGVINETYVSKDGESIGGVSIKNIGLCRQQIRKRFEDCENNCLKQYICINENLKNSGEVVSFCGYDWEVLKNRSYLNGCPIGESVFEFDESIGKCKYVPGNFCFKNEECSEGNNCDGNYQLTRYDPDKDVYSKFQNFNIDPTKDFHLLISKDYVGNLDPSITGYYYLEDASQNKWKIYYRTTHESPLENYIDITFEDEIIQMNKDDPTIPRFTVIKKKDGSGHQLNVEYLLEYENNRKRKYNKELGKFTYSGLGDGTSVYFENTPGVYNISFDSGYVDSFNGLLHKVKDGKGGSIQFPVDKDMFTYDSKYYIGRQGFEYQYIGSHGSGIEKGDKIFYNKKKDSTFTYRMGKDYVTYKEFKEGTCYYTYCFNPTESSDIAGDFNVSKYIYLTEDYNSTNYFPYLEGKYIDTFLTKTEGEPWGKPGMEYSYLQLQKLYGFNFLPIDLEGGKQDIVIKKRSDYVENENNFTTYNLPIGYLTDTTNIVSEIQEDKLLLTYIYNDKVTQTLNLSYEIGKGDKEYYNYTKLIIDNVGSSKYIKYTIENSFSQPCLKVPSVTDYDGENSPYQPDQVRYFNDTEDTDTISFLSNYKNINPDKNETKIFNISTMRKTDFLYETNEQEGYKLTMNYNGVKPKDYNFYNRQDAYSLPFGSTLYSSLSDIDIVSYSTAEEGVDSNFFIRKNNFIEFNDQNDINTILKYGSSDLVIGYLSKGKTDGKLEERALAITDILSYDIDELGLQSLRVQVCITILDFYKFQNVKLYVNNIFPMSLNIKDNQINDGRVLMASCLTEEWNSNHYPSPGVEKYSFKKTSYNKILAKPTGSNYFSFFDFYVIPGNFNLTYPYPYGTLKSFYYYNGSLGGESGFLVNLGRRIFEIPVNFSAISGGQIFATDDGAYILSSNFLSSAMLNSSIYLNNELSGNNFSVLGKYTSLEGKKLTRKKGSINMKLNTRPFFTGLNGDQGLLDLTYLNEVEWPSWISSLNTGQIKINKLFLNWNPGNMENDMFYYIFCEVNSVKMLLYLAVNVTVTDLKKSQPVPIILDLEESLNKNIFMTPYNNNLVILSKTCKSKT